MNAAIHGIRAFFKASLVLPVLWLGVAGQASTVNAQPSGIFTATGNMTTPRAQHTRSAEWPPERRVDATGLTPEESLELVLARLGDATS